MCKTNHNMLQFAILIAKNATSLHMNWCVLPQSQWKNLGQLMNTMLLEETLFVNATLIKKKILL